MALIRRFTRKQIDRPTLHEEIEASIAVIECDGRKLVQINSYGRATRDMPGKLSQTIQLDRDGASELFQFLKREFSF